VWICQISQEISQKRTRERMSDQEAKEIKSRSQRDHASAFYSQLQETTSCWSAYSWKAKDTHKGCVVCGVVKASMRWPFNSSLVISASKLTLEVGIVQLGIFSHWKVNGGGGSVDPWWVKVLLQ
ncbi:hypothetical protein Tco_1394930, partial [Tanacetum coccineum]